MTKSGGRQQWVPDDAVVIYPLDVVVSMFDHQDAASTRSYMSKNAGPQISGYPVVEVNEVLEARDPKLVEGHRRARKQRQEEES